MTKVYACPSCGSVFSRAKHGDFEPRHSAVTLEPAAIPLGTAGVLQGNRYIVIGILFRRDSSSKFEWIEYLLMDSDEETHWLVEADGHWALLTLQSKQPRNATQGIVYHGGRGYTLFHKGQAITHSYVGEIPWEAASGDRTYVRDYVNPPYMMNWERDGSGESWFSGQYVDASDVRRAFEVKRMPGIRGIGPSQPPPFFRSRPGIYKVTILSASVLLCLHILFSTMGHSVPILEGALEWKGDKPEATQTTDVFDLNGNGNVEIGFRSGLANSWVYVEARLVDEGSEHAWSTGQSLEFYSGVEDGETWSEGTQSGERVLPNIGPGKYRVVFVMHGQAGSPKTYINYQVTRNAPNHGNLLFGWLALALFPFLIWLRGHMFEMNRWRGSDFTPDGLPR